MSRYYTYRSRTVGDVSELEMFLPTLLWQQFKPLLLILCHCLLPFFLSFSFFRKENVSEKEERRKEESVGTMVGKEGKGFEGEESVMLTFLIKLIFLTTMVVGGWDVTLTDEGCWMRSKPRREVWRRFFHDFLARSFFLPLRSAASDECRWCWFVCRQNGMKGMMVRTLLT